MHVNGLLSRIKLSDLDLQFADSADGALEHLLDENPLLWVHTLIVALLQLPVDVDVLDVENCKVLEHLIFGPVRENRLAAFVLLLRLILVLHLFLQLVHCILQLQIKSPLEMKNKCQIKVKINFTKKHSYCNLRM